MRRPATYVGKRHLTINVNVELDVTELCPDVLEDFDELESLGVKDLFECFLPRFLSDG